MDITDDVFIRHISEDDPEAVDPDEIEAPEDSEENDDPEYLESISSLIDTSFFNIFAGLNDLIYYYK